MRIVARSVILFCFINLLVRGQIETNDSESEVLGNSEWWSNRITKINRKQPTIRVLDREDSERQDRRWEQEETGVSRRRPRPFALRATESRDRFESQRERYRNGKVLGVIGDVFNWERPDAPSPILLPPYAFSSPSHVHQTSSFDINNVELPWKNESSHAGKSSESSALDQIRIYEITTYNSSSNEKTDESKSNYDDDSSKTLDNDDGNRWVDIARKSSVNTTKTRSQQSDDKSEQNPARSFYINELRDNRRQGNGKPASSRIDHSIKNPRGSRKYQRDFESERTFMRKQAFTSDGKYDWKRRSSAQRSNHFKFNGDSNAKVGAVPGVPGRDYPVHQEHTHHNLRNVADRFPCPQTPKTHVYLADRASRCQIFYVCYGSKTGVPMVCPNGTLFSEPLQVCDWWFNVSC